MELGGFVSLRRGWGQRPGKETVKQFPPAGRAAEGGVGVERSRRAGRSGGIQGSREGDTGALGLLRAGGHGGLLCPRGSDGVTPAKVKPELSLACPDTQAYSG